MIDALTCPIYTLGSKTVFSWHYMIDTHQHLHVVVSLQQLPSHGISPHTVVSPFPRTNSNRPLRWLSRPWSGLPSTQTHQDLHTEDRSIQHDLIHSLICSLHILAGHYRLWHHSLHDPIKFPRRRRKRGESLPDVPTNWDKFCLFCFFVYLFISIDGVPGIWFHTLSLKYFLLTIIEAKHLSFSDNGAKRCPICRTSVTRLDTHKISWYWRRRRRKMHPLST